MTTRRTFPFGTPASVIGEQAAADRALHEAHASKDTAYRERNMCVAALARFAIGLGWRVGMGKHDPNDKAWEDDWHNLVVIESPAGQMTWHIHDSDMPLFEGIPPTDEDWVYVWDGHTTPQKYERLEAASVSAARGQRSKGG